MNFRQMADRIGFSEDEFMELVELFLESSLEELDHISAAAKEMDFSTMAMCAHSIRGAAINLGFEEIHALAKAIEGNARANELNGTIEAAEKIKDNLEQIVGTMVLSGRH